MPESDPQIDALDALLSQVADSPTFVAIMEKAEDSGHLDDDWIMSLTTGTASEEEEQNARRHLVFCQQCADLLLNRGGEVEDDESDDPRPKSPLSTEAAPRQSGLSPQVKRWLVGVVITVILGVFAFWILPSLFEAHFDTNASNIKGEPLVVGARGAGEQEQGSLSLSRLVYLKLMPQPDQGTTYIYVIIVSDKGDVIRIEPKAGRAMSIDYSDIVELPSEFGGYDLKAYQSLAAGRRVGFFVFTQKTRIPMFEGEIFELTTKPRIHAAFAALGHNLDEAGFRALAGEIRKMGLSEHVLATSIRLIP